MSQRVLIAASTMQNRDVLLAALQLLNCTNVKEQPPVVSFDLPPEVVSSHWGRQASVNLDTGQLAGDTDYKDQIGDIVSHAYSRAHIENFINTTGVVETSRYASEEVPGEFAYVLEV
jgi:hypothetical protein